MIAYERSQSTRSTPSASPATSSTVLIIGGGWQIQLVLIHPPNASSRIESLPESSAEPITQRYICWQAQVTTRRTGASPR